MNRRQSTSISGKHQPENYGRGGRSSLLPVDMRRRDFGRSESALAHHFAKMSQRSTFRHGAVAEGGPTTLVSTWEKGAARQGLAAAGGGLGGGGVVVCGFL